MVSFKRNTFLDRRSPENLYLSILVDLGVTYKRTLGRESARAFFNEHEIPHPVVMRVMADEPPRRRTMWEESALRSETEREMKP